MPCSFSSKLWRRRSEATGDSNREACGQKADGQHGYAWRDPFLSTANACFPQSRFPRPSPSDLTETDKQNDYKCLKGRALCKDFLIS